MGFYPVEVLINDAKRHGVRVLPVDVNRSRYRTTTEWVGLPDEPLPEGAGIDERPVVVRSSGCVVPDARRPATTGRRRRDRLRHPARAAPRQGHRRGGGGGARRRDQRARPVRVAGRPRRADRAVRGGRRAAHPRGRARLAGRAAPRAAVAAAARCGNGAHVGSQAAGRSTCGCRRPRRPTCRHPPSSSGSATPTRSCRSTRARQVIELFRPALDRLGVLTRWRARRAQAGPGAHRRPRRHPPAPDDRARHGLPGARGRDRHGQRHALAGHLGALPADRAAPRAALRGGPARARVERGQRDRRSGRVAHPRWRGRPAGRLSRRACATWATPGCVELRASTSLAVL